MLSFFVRVTFVSRQIKNMYFFSFLSFFCFEEQVSQNDIRHKPSAMKITKTDNEQRKNDRIH